MVHKLGEKSATRMGKPGRRVRIDFIHFTVIT